MRRKVTMTACDEESYERRFTVGKYMSPYGKSTSSRFKLLPFKVGLGFRVVFGFSFVFWNRRGLTERLLYQGSEHGQWQTSHRAWGCACYRTLRKLRKTAINGGLLGALA